MNDFYFNDFLMRINESWQGYVQLYVMKNLVRIKTTAHK